MTISTQFRVEELLQKVIWLFCGTVLEAVDPPVLMRIAVHLRACRSGGGPQKAMIV